MTRSTILVASASALAVAVFAASPASAAGTTQGTWITNNVSVAYQVGGVAQNPATATDKFLVDRKVVLAVADLGATTTTVSPGQTAAVTGFTITNSSNDSMNFKLTLTQQVGGASAHGGTDDFNVTAPALYVDTNGNGVYDPGVDQPVAGSTISGVAADTSVTVFVVSNIPLGLNTNDVADVRLAAAAVDGTGTQYTTTAGGDTPGVVATVCAEQNTADGNVKNDCADWADNDYTVLAAALTATKTDTVVSDPIDGTTNPKRIPGAVVQYCIAVTNAAGGAAASNVSISDTLPAQTTFVANSIKVNATVSGGTCTGGSAGGSFAGGVVSGTLGNIAAGSSSGLSFQVTIN